MSKERKTFRKERTLIKLSLTSKSRKDSGANFRRNSKKFSKKQLSHLRNNIMIKMRRRKLNKEELQKQRKKMELTL